MNKLEFTITKRKTSMVGGDDHQTIGVPGKSIGISDHLSKTTRV